MRVLKTKQNLFILIIDVAIFTGVMIGVLVTTKLTSTPAEPNVKGEKLNQVQAISTYVIGDYSKEEDKSVANINLQQDLKKKYDIDVYSAQSAELAAQSVEASGLYDVNSTYNILNGLVNCLAKYPKNIFYEIQNKDYDVSIYIVKSFNNNNIALATRDSNNSFNIYLSNTSLLEKAVHHELYHILEYYMKLEYDINILYKDWSKYNPSGFKYNSNIKELGTQYAYNPYTKEPGAYFITIYAKSADKEDRAETFADMMLINSTPIYYSKGEKIGEKAKYISRVLEKSFKSVKESKDPIYWGRFLY